MKIGKLDLKVNVAVFGALLLFGIIFVYRMYTGSATDREIGSRVDAVRSAWIGGEAENFKVGVKECEAILKLRPKHLAARLHLGSFLFRLGEYKDAEKHFEKASKSSNKEAKTWGLIGLATTKFERLLNKTDNHSERIKEINEDIEPLLRKAVETNPSNTTGNAALCVLLTWKRSDAAVGEAIRIYKKIRAGKGGKSKSSGYPTLEPAKEMEITMGSVNLRRNNPLVARGAFGRALAFEPDNKDLKTLMQLATLAGVSHPDLPDNDRLELMNRMERQGAGQFRDQMLYYKMSMAIAYFYKKRKLGKKEYFKQVLRRQDVFQRAQGFFIGALALGSGDALVYENYGAFLEDSTEIMRTNLSVKYWTRFSAPPENPWKKTVADKPATAAYKPTPEERETARRYGELIQLRIDLIDSRKSKTNPSKSEERAMRLEKLKLMRRKAFLTVAGRKRDQMLKEAKESAEESLEVFPNDTDIKLQQALILADLDKWKEATPLLQDLKDSLPEDMMKLVDRLERKPFLFNHRPAGKSQSLRRIPLISVSWDIDGGMFPIRPGDVEIHYDGRLQKAAEFVGSQLLLIPSPVMMTRGKHKIEFKLKDRFGNKDEKEGALEVDKDGPTISISPKPGGKLNVGDQIWTVKLEDAGVGVDLSSIEIKLYAGKKEGLKVYPTQVKLVIEGQFQRAVKIGKFSIGRNEKIASDEFKVLFNRLQSGECRMEIRCGDRAGNPSEPAVFEWTVQ